VSAHSILAATVLASYIGSQWAGKERTWYPLLAHVLNFPKILGLYLYIHDNITYTYHYIVRTFSDQQWSVWIIRSPAPSSSLRRLSASDMSLKKVQVVSSLDFCWD